MKLETELSLNCIANLHISFYNKRLLINYLPTVTNIHINCKDCGINKLCLPALLAEAEVAHLNSIIKRNTPLIKKGSHIFDAGDAFNYVYAIRAGAFKSYVNSYSGEQQIVGFHLPGDLIGLDAINSKTHNSSAVALMDSQVCKIPYEMLDELSAEIKGVRTQLLRMLSNELTADQELLLILGQKQAKERLAALLVNLSARYKVRNLPYDSFFLPMSRGEVANYLGLTIETVSRTLKELKDKGIIDIKGKHLSINDLSVLQRIAGIYCELRSMQG